MNIGIVSLTRKESERNFIVERVKMKILIFNLFFIRELTMMMMIINEKIKMATWCSKSTSEVSASYEKQLHNLRKEWELFSERDGGKLIIDDVRNSVEDDSHSDSTWLHIWRQAANEKTLIIFCIWSLHSLNAWSTLGIFIS